MTGDFRGVVQGRVRSDTRQVATTEQGHAIIRSHREVVDTEGQGHVMTARRGDITIGQVLLRKTSVRNRKQERTVDHEIEDPAEIEACHVMVMEEQDQEVR